MPTAELADEAVELDTVSDGSDWPLMSFLRRLTVVAVVLAASSLLSLAVLKIVELIGVC